GLRLGFPASFNVLILRCVAERAMAQGATAYITRIDLQTAFPSVGHPQLWLKLYHVGVSGPLFD
ncbi:hypothetical protein CALVIDRAFT_459139, partial [Calocera viscosa TUFC12733]